MQTRGNCMVNPKQVHMEHMIQGHHSKENCLLQNLCRNLSEEMCSVMSLAAEWVCGTAHLGVSPDCTGGCWAADPCHSVPNIPASCSDTTQGSLSHSYTCAQCDPRTTGSYSSKASLFHHIFLHYSFWTLLQAYPCYLLAQCAKAKSDRSSAGLLRLLIMCHEPQWLWGLGVFRNAV